MRSARATYSARLGIALVLAACATESGTPTVGEPTGPPAPGEDGASCFASTDCFGSVCLTELESGLPNGYCTSFDCVADGCRGGTCVVDGRGNSACVDTCTAPSDCRDGYDCVDGGGVKICDVPDTPGTEVGVSPDGACVRGCQVGDPLVVECGFTPSRHVLDDVSQWGLPYQLTSGVRGFTLSVWSEDEAHAINALSIRNDLDDLLELKGADSALNVTSFVDNRFLALNFPFAPIYANFVDGDTGVLQVQSSAESLCISRAEGLQGDELSMHVYFVSEDLAPRLLGVDPDIDAMVDEMRRLFGLAGIDLAQLVAEEVDARTIERYRFVRSLDDLAGVLATTRDPAELVGNEDDPEASLVLNLVLVDSIMLQNGGDTIGQAGLVPGPPGIHGRRVSGVVAETESLREAPDYLALIVVHESAHYLGLRHTSEVFAEAFAFGRVDPLEDTPECPDVRALMETCPDYANLMFPLAPTSRSQSLITLSEDQGWVLRHNPLVR